MKKTKIVIWGISAVLLVIILLITFGKLDGAKDSNYKTYTVKSENTSYFPGIVKEDDKEPVSSQVKSYDETLISSVKSGQKVIKGQTLFTFYRNMSSEANSYSLEARQAQLAIQQYSSSQKTTEDQIELAKNQEALSEAQDKINKLNQQQNRTVTAPISGTYYKDDEGRSYVYGEPELVGNVNEFNLDKIKLGKKVTIIENNGKEIEGMYSQKDTIPYSSRSVSYYHFKVTTSHDLPYGMHVQFKNATRGYKIPHNAVKDSDTVYIVRNHKKHKVVLDMTKYGSDYYAKKGIKAGDKLVLF